MADILVVGRDEEPRGTYIEMLERVGHRITLAKSGEEALFVLQAKPEIGLIICCNIRLSDMMAYDFIHAAKEEFPSKKTLLITGFVPPDKTPEENHEEALRAGFNMVLSKPVSMEDLRQAARILSNEK